MMAPLRLCLVPSVPGQSSNVARRATPIPAARELRGNGREAAIREVI